MKKRIIIGILIIAVLILIYLLNFLGMFSFMNRYFIKDPDPSCIVDSDCTIKKTSCNYCDCGETVNKDWNLYCPFRKPPIQVMCKTCSSLNVDFELKCVENQCQKIWKSN